MIITYKWEVWRKHWLVKQLTGETRRSLIAFFLLENKTDDAVAIHFNKKTMRGFEKEISEQIICEKLYDN